MTDDTRMLFEQIKKKVRSQHRVGDNAIKYGRSVYVCKKCLKPVVLDANGSYRCLECNMRRNIQQREWQESEQAIDFRKVEE